jgi:hypothetical protein
MGLHEQNQTAGKAGDAPRSIRISRKIFGLRNKISRFVAKVSSPAKAQVVDWTSNQIKTEGPLRDGGEPQFSRAAGL